MSKEAMKLALEALNSFPPRHLTPLISNARTALREALAEQPAQQEPVAWLTDDEREAFERFNETCEDGEGYDVPKTMMRRLAEIGVIHHTSRGIYGITKFGRSLVGYTTPPQRKPQFKEFIKWAGAQGYDCAQTCNSDTGEWIVLNPMTADLWKAWQAAHNIKENT